MNNASVVWSPWFKNDIDIGKKYIDNARVVTIHRCIMIVFSTNDNYGQYCFQLWISLIVFVNVYVNAVDFILKPASPKNII